jgi:hypothetical protein
MADLSTGAHAKVILTANEVLRVEADGGSTAVLANYGAPAGTTTVTSASREFGPYGLPASLTVTATSGTATYNLHEYVAPADASVSVVSTDMTSTQVTDVLEDAGEPELVDAPWGRGREVVLNPGSHDVAVANISQSQSISCAGPGSSTLVFARHSAVTGETAMILVDDDRLSKRSIPGRGVIRNLSMDGANNDPNVTAFPVHGYWADTPAVDGESHSFHETLFTGMTGDGIKIDGRKQFRALYAKCVAVDGVALNLKDVNDLKSFGCGWNGQGGAAKFRHLATPKFIAGDMWIPDDFDGQATLDVADQVRMLVDAYEIEGRTVLVGRNFGNTNRWESGVNIFRADNFKIVEGLAPSFTYTRDDATTVSGLSCMVYLEDTDNTFFDTCTLRYAVVTPTAAELTATPDYFVQIGTKKTGALNIAMYPGHVKFQNMSGIVHSRGRVGDSNPILAFKKHYSNRPELVEWDFRAGGLDLIAWNDAAPPRHYVKATAYGATTPDTKTKAALPMGYLFATLTTGGTLDDVNTTWNVPIAPTPAPAGMAWAFRVWP